MVRLDLERLAVEKRKSEIAKSGNRKLRIAKKEREDGKTQLAKEIKITIKRKKRERAKSKDVEGCWRMSKDVGDFELVARARWKWASEIGISSRERI